MTLFDMALGNNFIGGHNNCYRTLFDMALGNNFIGEHNNCYMALFEMALGFFLVAFRTFRRISEKKNRLNRIKIATLIIAYVVV